MLVPSDAWLTPYVERGMDRPSGKRDVARVVLILRLAQVFKSSVYNRQPALVMVYTVCLSTKKVVSQLLFVPHTTLSNESHPPIILLTYIGVLVLGG